MLNVLNQGLLFKREKNQTAKKVTQFVPPVKCTDLLNLTLSAFKSMIIIANSKASVVQMTRLPLKMKREKN